MSAAGAGSRRAEATIDEVDFYQLLGVPYHATTGQITRAYRAAMKENHPDRQRPHHRGAAEERAKLLNRAFTTLSKPHLRQSYDQKIRAQVMQDQIMHRYVGGFVIPPADGADPLGMDLRREQSSAERREQVQSERNAILSVVLVFGAIAAAVVAALVLWAAVNAVVDAVV